MPSLLAERLRQARHERFVGREKERALFSDALRADVLPFHLLYLHGPGGVGKTALLGELRYLCSSEQWKGFPEEHSGENGTPGEGDSHAVPVYHLDARDVEPTAGAFREALERARAAAANTPPGASSSNGESTDRRSVLMIDTFEVLQPLARWFQEDFLPGLPQSTLIVVAGRMPPPPSWRAEAGLQALMREVPLRNLPPQESRRYLARRGVPEREREAVAQFACGHPLALSLASDSFDQNPEQTFAPARTPELVKTLVKRFVEDVPSPAHRRALEACAAVRSLSEALLDHLLQAEGLHDAGAPVETSALFEWLRTLSFVEAGPRGIFPHDLAREVLGADLRWRRPERHEALQCAARRFYTERLHRTAGARTDAEVHERVLSDYLFLYRDNPVVAPLFARLRQQWQGRSLVATPAEPGDWPALLDMTRRHEGEASAALLDYWKDRPAAETTVFREKGEEDGVPAGFSTTLSLEDVSDADRARDPSVEAACRHLDAEAPLREGETAVLFRYWMDREEHQTLSPVLSLISTRRVRYYLSTPALAFSFIACAAPDEWALVLAYADMHRLSEADYSVGERSFALFGHDWRATPPAVWLDRMTERTITDRPADEVPPASPAPRLVLSRGDFAGAVKDALKNITRLDRLRRNPLARAALVEEAAHGGEEESAEVLRRLLREAAEQLRSSPREERYYHALDATYLDPVGTQEEAAEAVDAAFSTFRRHLKRAIEHVTDALWEQETGRARAR